MSDWMKTFLRGIAAAFVIATIVTGGGSSDALAATCTGMLPSGSGEDLEVTGACLVKASSTAYQYGNVNIYGGGKLIFEDGTTTFWASSILVEKDGSLLAGVDEHGNVKPIGTTPGAVLTIYLYGAPQSPGTDSGKNDGGKGITCKSNNGSIDPPCGIPADVWKSDGGSKFDLPGGVNDYFYKYHPLTYDDGDPNAFFGYKVLAVSYGGTLKLFGKKGVKGGDLPSSDSGYSWARLAKSLKPEEKQLTLDRGVDWGKFDRIVVTTTDYLPGHSEQLEITNISDCNNGLCKTFDVVKVDENTDKPTSAGVTYHHNGEPFDLSHIPDRLHLDIKVDGKPAAETRAAVALLSRSIRVVSAGNKLGDLFPDKTGAAPDRYFGGHTIVRQGFQTYQIQGVEFRWLGQGGRIGHYPVHFHMARTTPSAVGNETFVKDTSVNESMTRWYVLHATHGVTLAGNVGYESIGHGYYLEDGTEINNKLHSNIGILARAAVENDQNPRKVPGILAGKLQNPPWATDAIPFYTDFDHPTVFWIMNGWNDFEYNMAAGAGTCGACYWLVTGANSYHSRHLKWDSYAALQQASANQPNGVDRAGTSPLKKFVGNYCSSAMNSFNTVSNGSTCQGVGSGVVGRDVPALTPIPNPLAPDPCDPTNPKDGPFEPFGCNKPAHQRADNYYPKVDQGGGRFATRCNADDEKTAGGCDKVNKCAGATLQDANLGLCMVTVLDRYTSGFHFAETNFGAIWLRPQWYLMINSVLSDVQNAGLGIVTGGGYSASDHIPGHWGLARKGVFIGNSQDLSPDKNPNWYASNAGPVNPKSGLACDKPLSGNHCLVAKEGVSFPISNFAVNQRLFNIYDGPSYQDSNAYLDITPAILDGDHSRWVAGPTLGLPKDDQGLCYMPNAAIAWKQPNGFFYPPAFHSTNLHFDNVEIRHFVIEPLFLPATGKDGPPYPINQTALDKRYCNQNSGMFTGFTDVDRQTVLNDDDGSLTGFANTISVNFNSPFFTAPSEAVECASDATAKTSPYDYVTTVVYPYCGLACKPLPPPPDAIQLWDVDCANEMCYGVPLYRQLITPAEKAAGTVPLVRMSGQSIGQRSTLTANGGTYYIDTTVSEATQKKALASDPAKRPPKLNVFESNQTYYLFVLFAKTTTKQTYQLYVGSGFSAASDVWAVKANVSGKPVTFTGKGVVAWPATWPTPVYDGKILTVTMDMGFSDFKTNYDKSREESCLPKSFCSPTGAGDQLQCKCSDQLKASDPQLFAECQKDNDAICSWAVKDVDCPEGGCYGFAVKLGTLAYDPIPDVRPAPQLFTADQANFDAYWKVFFQDAAPGLAGNCAVKPTGISAFNGTATNVGSGVGKGAALLKGTFTPSLNPPLIFDLAAAQNVTLNTVLHTQSRDGNKELVEGLNLPLRLVRQTKADPEFTATFALAATGAPASPRLNVKQNGGSYTFNLKLDNITIRDAPHCGNRNDDVKLITSFGMYDVAQPIEIEVEGEWDCSNKTRYIGHN